MPVDSSDLNNENGTEDESDAESDTSVSTVNTEDLSEVDFSEDEEEIGWSRDPMPVNGLPSPQDQER